MPIRLYPFHRIQGQEQGAHTQFRGRRNMMEPPSFHSEARQHCQGKPNCAQALTAQNVLTALTDQSKRLISPDLTLRR